VILNNCYYDGDASTLANFIPTVIVWAGTVDDGQTTRFSGQLSGYLAGGSPTGGAFDSALITIAAT
jgi:hypothetical protein